MKPYYSTVPDTTAAYELRLAQRCTEFARRWPEKDAAIRVVTLRQLGLRVPPISELVTMVYERKVRANIAEVMKWPDEREWVSGRPSPTGAPPHA